jgi:enoyl-CoA hydratase/carnithine racemase
MSFVTLSRDREIAILTLSRGKVNAINDAVVDELSGNLREIEADESLRAVILTGKGSFFSFGFDIPEFLSLSPEAFTGYLQKFTSLYAYIFLFPKPVIAALNGHTVAGGCMIATACDCRLMVAGKAKISLNEVNFGSSVFAGSVAMLKHCVGSPNTERILYSGKMYSAEEALDMGLIDAVTSKEDLPSEALRAARDLGRKESAAFRSIKNLVRRHIAEEMSLRETDSIREFVDIWYSENTWKNLQLIEITA